MDINISYGFKHREKTLRYFSIPCLWGILGWNLRRELPHSLLRFQDLNSCMKKSATEKKNP